MAKLVVMEEAGLDIRRLTEFLLQAHPEDAVGLVDNIISALKILEQHPEAVQAAIARTGYFTWQVGLLGSILVQSVRRPRRNPAHPPPARIGLQKLLKMH
jgi:hypothetical protein